MALLALLGLLALLALLAPRAWQFLLQQRGHEHLRAVQRY